MTLKFVPRYLICLWALMLTSASWAGPFTLGGESRFPPADKVFHLDASRDGNIVTVRWYVLPGYYLYRHRLHFSASRATLGKPEIPQGEKKQDEYFGEVEIYRDELSVSIPVTSTGEPVVLTVGYQGCADAGYCYPPQKKRINVSNLP